MKKLLLLTLIFSFHSTANNNVKGYADLHVHMFANDAFAGAWFTGNPNEKDYGQLFKHCKNETSWPWLKKTIEKIDPYVSSFLYRNHCVPKQSSFPAWNDLAHQQVWFKDLKKAKESGLSLMIMSSVHSYVLCRVLPSSRKRFESCEDEDNHVRQLKNAKKFIDESDWAELALTPMDVKRIINEDKLAIIFSVESSNLFDSDNWKAELQKYWDLGVRTLQVVHQFDNEIAGAAMHKGPLKFAHYLRNWMKYDEIKGFESETVEYKTEFGTRQVQRNKKGLTKKGQKLINHMMDLGMPIDFAHMSEKTMKDVIRITETKDYPFYFSHGHFRDAHKGGLGKFEKSSSKEILMDLKKADGIFGVRTITYPTFQVDKNIQNNCDGSSLSFAHILKFGQDLGVNIAFGSDFNGFIPQTRPRFSDTDKEYCKNQKVERLGKSFDTSGLGNINQLPDLLLDLKNLGADTHGLENSSQKFLEVWQRSYAKRKMD